jgi:electron transport complex protein RnfB
MIAALLTIVILVATIAIGLSLASARLGGNRDQAVERLNQLLPQTQCGQCGYPGCRPYAEAIVAGAAAINQCPPGGEATILAIGHLLDRPPTPPDPDFGNAKPAQVAVIAENICIGCGLCLQECPVDAILGAPHYMHTVIDTECTGCELCVAPCPVDCITMEPV